MENAKLINKEKEKGEQSTTYSYSLERCKMIKTLYGENQLLPERYGEEEQEGLRQSQTEIQSNGYTVSLISIAILKVTHNWNIEFKMSDEVERCF